ncbi:(R,R)-butanediol dehydrogenase [Diutina catenulata]
MKAIIYTDQLHYVEDYPEPEVVKPDDVKLHIDFCGICGTDLKEVTDGPIFFPQTKDGVNAISGIRAKVMGHEMSGVVVAIGSGVTSVKLGDSVVVEVTGTCLDKPRYRGENGSREAPPDACLACKQGCYNACDFLGLTGLGFSDGGLAEYCVVPEFKLVKFNAGIVPMDVAALIQPLAVSWHAVEVSRFRAGQSCVILGGGPIGLTTIFALKGHGAGKIIVSEPTEARRKLAERLGAITYDPSGKSPEECVRDLVALSPDGIGFGHSYDCSGSPETFQAMTDTLQVRGVATNVAIWADRSVPFYPMRMTSLEKSLTGSMCFTKTDFEGVARAIERGDIPVSELRLMITDRRPLSDCDAAFEELMYHKKNHVKMMFYP